MPKAFFIRKPIRLNDVISGMKEMKELFKNEDQPYYIAEEIELSNREWEDLTSNFFAARDWIKGFSAKEYHDIEEGVACIRVTCPGSEIALIIDPQGHDYARYVSIEAEGASKSSKEETQPGKHTVVIKMFRGLVSEVFSDIEDIQVLIITDDDDLDEETDGETEDAYLPPYQVY